MFVILYEFHVSAEDENEFRELFPRVVETARARDALGARLHPSVTDETLWYSYAPWHRREDWVERNPLHHFDDDQALMGRFREMVTPRVVQQFEVIEDLLVT